jgi:acyl-CoA hydrolase
LEKYITADEAVKKIKSNQKVFVHGSAATPVVLLQSLSKRADELRNVEIFSLSTYGEMPLANLNFRQSFYFNALFVSQNIRELVHAGMGSYIPVFLSEIPALFHQKIIQLDVALIHVSPPDIHGYCSLGVSVDVALAAIKNAKYVIAQVNPKMPRTQGDGILHLNEIDALVDVSQELPEIDYTKEITPTEKAIGKHCASLIEDGATLQLGIGSIPDAVLGQLEHHKDLGIHTEMFSNGIIDLLNKGVITNKYKKKHRRKVVTTFAIGNRAMYDFINENPVFSFLESDYVNDAYVIGNNPKVTAINSAIEIDITGQVCADSIGTKQFSGVGGQMDFMRGASISEGGKPIIAMSSITSKGNSKIVPFLKEGAGVVSTRANVHYVITENGIAYLHGKNLVERAKSLIEIAHPNHREMLEIAYRNRFGGNKMFSGLG